MNLGTGVSAVSGHPSPAAADAQQGEPKSPAVSLVPGQQGMVTAAENGNEISTFSQGKLRHIGKRTRARGNTNELKIGRAKETNGKDNTD